ncbi:hypothetical protein H9P43_006126 [Blastocladiella emersonii ATCC 22665]|nr:hypothetical protein H9P43_006126 [Blastocladiella emersonii ATCC 22665]
MPYSSTTSVTVNGVTKTTTQSSADPIGHTTYSVAPGSHYNGGNVGYGNAGYTGGHHVGGGDFSYGAGQYPHLDASMFTPVAPGTVPPTGDLGVHSILPPVPVPTVVPGTTVVPGVPVTGNNGIITGNNGVITGNNGTITGNSADWGAWTPLPAGDHTSGVVTGTGTVLPSTTASTMPWQQTGVLPGQQGFVGQQQGFPGQYPGQPGQQDFNAPMDVFHARADWSGHGNGQVTIGNDMFHAGTSGSGVGGVGGNGHHEFGLANTGVDGPIGTQTSSWQNGNGDWHGVTSTTMPGHDGIPVTVTTHDGSGVVPQIV